MKVKKSNKPIIIVAVCILIVIILVFMDSRKNKPTDYSNMTENEVVSTVQNEIDEMKVAKLSTQSERDRIEYYVSTFIDAIEESNYEKAYGMLYDDFKTNYFSTQESFEEYVKTKFPKVISIEHTNFERNGDFYVLWSTMSDLIKGKSSALELNFVVQENELNDFKLSFSVK